MARSGQRAVSETDPQAPKQRIGWELRAGYNAQSAVDVGSGMIVAQAP